MPIWSDFSGLTDDDLEIEHLRSILRCHELTDIKQFFIDRAVALEKNFNEKRWDAVVRAQYTAKLNTNKINQSIFSILNDGSVPFGAMAGGISTISPITVAATSMVAIVSTITGVSALLTILIGAFYFASAYRKQKKENLDNIDEYALIGIKTACADLLINKYYQHKNAVRPHVAPPAFHYENKNRLDKVKSSFGPAVMIGFMAFGSFYLGSTVVVTTLSLSAAAAAFAGPIGLAVAFGIGLILTGIMLYAFYRSSINAEKVTQLKAHNTDILISKAEEINTLHNEYELNLAQAGQHELPQPVNLHAEPPVIKALPPPPAPENLPPPPVIHNAAPPPLPGQLPPPPAWLNNLAPAHPPVEHLPPPPNNHMEAVAVRPPIRRNSAPILMMPSNSTKETEELSTSARLAVALNGGKILPALPAANNLRITASNLIPAHTKLEGSGEGNTSNARIHTNGSHANGRKH
jgi:hypothetical protein